MGRWQNAAGYADLLLLALTLLHLTLEETMRALSILAAFAATALLMGCGTVNSYANRCGGVYSGLKTDFEYLDSYHEFYDGWDYATVGLDVPLSSIIDTVALPVTYFLEPSTDKTYGCEWAGSGGEISSSMSASGSY